MAIARVLIRKYGKDAEGNAYPTYDVLSEFGLWTQNIPFPLTSEIKEVDSNDYHDEDGEQEWAQGQLRFKSYMIDVTWIARGERTALRKRFEKFRDYLSGADGTGTTFMMYSMRHGIGRRNMRLNKIYEDIVYDDIDNNNFVIQFKMQFKVNDPVGVVELDDEGNIVTGDGSGLVIFGESISPDRIRMVGTTMYID